MQVRSYPSVRDTLKTGDIVLFSGRSVISKTIRFVTRSKWSHVAMVIRLPEPDLVMLWEANRFSAEPDYDEGGRLDDNGVRLVPMSDKVAAYKGELAVRTLEGVHFDDEDYSRLWQLRQDLKARPYETSIAELLKAEYDGPFGKNRENLSSLFCSELVAEAYQTLGLLPHDVPSNEYTPADFSTEKDAGVRLLVGALAPEYALVP